MNGKEVGSVAVRCLEVGCDVGVVAMRCLEGECDVDEEGLMEKRR